METQSCNRAGKWFGGKCRFEARYDVGVPDTTRLTITKMNNVDVTEVIEACRPSTYVHDICIHCGKTVGRTPPP